MSLKPLLAFVGITETRNTTFAEDRCQTCENVPQRNSVMFINKNHCSPLLGSPVHIMVVLNIQL